MASRRSKFTETAKSMLPWNKGVAWGTVLTEGIVLFGLGLFMFFAHQSTNLILGWITSLSLLTSGGVKVYHALKIQDDNLIRKWMLIYGLIGAIPALLAIVILVLGVNIKTLGLPILGLGCLGFGAFGLYLILGRKILPLKNASTIDDIIYLAIGILILLQVFNVGALVTIIQAINMIIMIGGIVLIFWALILRNEPATRQDS